MGKYKLYHLTFLDHVMGTDKPLTCFLVGYLIKENDDSYVVSPWIVNNPDYVDNNFEKFCILKSTILDIYEIEIKT